MARRGLDLPRGGIGELSFQTFYFLRFCAFLGKTESERRHTRFSFPTVTQTPVSISSQQRRLRKEIPPTMGSAWPHYYTRRWPDFFSLNAWIGPATSEHSTPKLLQQSYGTCYRRELSKAGLTCIMGAVWEWCGPWRDYTTMCYELSFR